MIQIFTSADSVQVHRVCDLLNDNDIRAIILGETLEHAAGGLPIQDIYPAVWINPEDEDDALRIIEGHFREMGLAAPLSPEECRSPWICPQCGQTLEGQFSACWNCQTPRPPCKGTVSE